MIRTDHGSPFDRGAADSHYGRAHAPHKGGGGRRGGRGNGGGTNAPANPVGGAISITNAPANH